MNLDEQLRSIIVDLGPERALEILNAARQSKSEEVLTIVSNEGMHRVPTAFSRGTVYAASTGMLDLSSSDRVREQFNEILLRLTSVLKSRTWSKIYLIPFGHASLSMQIKLLVYRVTRLETVDLFYDGKGGYFDLDVDLRPIIVAARGN